MQIVANGRAGVNFTCYVTTAAVPHYDCGISKCDHGVVCKRIEIGMTIKGFDYGAPFL